MNGVPPQARRHSRIVKALVLIASLLTVVAIFAAWVERQALDTNEWVNTSGRLIQNDTIRAAVAGFAVDQLYANVNVNGQLQQRLPKEFKPLAGPAASGLRQVAQQAADQILQSARFQQFWENANRAAHETLIKVVEDKGRYASTGNGNVTLHLRPLITDVANQLGLGGEVAGKIPPDVGNLTVLRSDELNAAQKVVKAIRGFALLTTVLVLILLGLAIYLSRGYRWTTLLGIGIGLIAAGSVVLILRSVAQGPAVDALATTEAARAPAEAAWPIATSLLSEISRYVITLGIFFVIAAWLGSPHASAVATRRALTPILRDYPAIVFSVVALIGVIYILADAGTMRQALIRIFIVALAIIGLVYLRRNSIRDFPDAQLGDVTRRMRHQALQIWERRGRGGGPPLPPSPEDQRLERLERLAGLHERGVLSDDEFEREKTAVLVRED